MLRYNRNRARGRFFPLFSPRELFYGSVPGAWYDPTDLSTMFQDSTGTTPVTAVEQPVGLILDKSQGLANGPELSPNIGPYTNTTDWTGINSAVLSATGGELLITAGNTYSGAYITANVVAGTWLDVTIVARRGTATAAYVSILNQTNTVIVDGFGNPSLAIGATNTTVRTRFLVPAGMTQARLLVIHDNQAVGRTLFCSSASARTLAGNHASQSTAASRPTYRARYNLLTYSEQFDLWSLSSVAISTNTTTAPNGTQTADSVIESAVNAIHRISQQTTLPSGVAHTLSVYARPIGSRRLYVNAVALMGAGALFDLTGTGSVVATSGSAPNLAVSIEQAGGGWYRCILRGTGTGVLANAFFQINRSTSTTASDDSYLGDGTSGLILWGAQLLTAADVTATGNAYQRIAAATVYDTAPIFRPYLAFDGMDDSLSTAAINFTSTNKMTVYTGLSKLSDATLAIFAELSTVTGPNAGSWYIAAPITTGAGGNYSWRNAGTALSGSADSGTLLAPNTSVLTGTCDIGTLTQALRVNGALAASGIVAIGGGNYGNWPLFIGRRNNASFPFNGRLFSLIVRGAASSTTEIIDTETWVNARTGGY